MALESWEFSKLDRKHYVNKTYEIVLCSNCKGKGETDHEELVDYHKRDYRYWTEPCKPCEGTGRLKKITTVEYQTLGKPVGKV